jgi:hypothetical protein
MDMHKLLILVSTAIAALAITTAAGASPPAHVTFTGHDQGIDSGVCGFPIAFDIDFENDLTAFIDAEGGTVRLKLHQAVTGLFTANGVTLHERDTWEVFVDFADGVPVQSKHVGVEFHLRGPDGRLALVTGQTVFQVVNGFDGPVIAQHGLQLEASDAQVCAAFS